MNDGANAIHQTTKAAVDDLGFNKPGLIKWGKWLVGKLGPFGYFATIVLSPILIPASLAYDAGRGMKLLFRKITGVEEPVQKLLPMMAKQVQEAGKLKQHKQQIDSRHAEVSAQLAAWKTHSGELKSLNDQVNDQAKQLELKLKREQKRNHQLNVLLERLANRADGLEINNEENSKRYQDLRVALDKQLAEKSVRIAELSKELEAARQQHDHDQEGDMRTRQEQADVIHNLESKLAADQQQMSDLEGRYEAEICRLSGRHLFETMKSDNQHKLELKELSATLQSEMDTLAGGYEETIKAIEAENEEQVQKLRAECRELNQRMKDQCANNESLQFVETSLRAQVSQLEQQYSKSCDQLTSLKEQYINLLKEKEAKAKTEIHTRSQLESRIKELQATLDIPKDSRGVQTSEVTVSESRERVDTASQVEEQPLTVLVNTDTQTEIGSSDAEFHMVEGALPGAGLELLIKQAVSEDEELLGMPVHGNSEQEEVNVNVGTQHELENITDQLHAAENNVLHLSNELHNLMEKLKSNEGDVARLVEENKKLSEEKAKQDEDLNSLEMLISGERSDSADLTGLKEALKDRLEADAMTIGELDAKSKAIDEEKRKLLTKNQELHYENERLLQAVNQFEALQEQQEKFIELKAQQKQQKQDDPSTAELPRTETPGSVAANEVVESENVEQKP
ncbi:hypothetical protein J7438_07605 [Thalassotalea sp. G20_0]|nr:hypothetical protein [Thalassotalea sp. G20_0]